MAEQEARKQIGNYNVLGVIGRGGFGTVYLCEDKLTKEKYAIKEIKGKSKIDPKTEIEIHKRLTKKRSKKVVKIYGNFELGGSVFLVMEYCKHGSLRDYLKKNGPLEVLIATDILRQLCDALKLMHDENIAHRDLTPNNVLICDMKKGKNDEGDEEVKKIYVKITDFGLSKEAPKNEKGQFKTTLGTGPFMAPEVLAGRYTKSADVFALGSMFYFLLTKNYLSDKFITAKHFQSELSPVLSRIMSMPSVKRFDENVQARLKSFIRGMLCSETDRIHLDEIEQHEYMGWFQNELNENPNLRELRSQSQTGPSARARLNHSSSHSRESSRKLLVAGSRQELMPPKRSNKDSAFGSDQSHSGSGRCRHQQIDSVTGRCKNCLYKLTTALARDNTEQPKQRYNIDQPPPLSEPNGYQKENKLEASSPALKNEKSSIYKSIQPPWPFPTITHDYSLVNEWGRCIFIKYSNPRGQLQLVAILERTTSKEDQTICRVYELRQNDDEQEFRIFQPEKKNLCKPERNGRRIGIGNEMAPRIISHKGYHECKMARDGYETLWGFLKMAASKIIQAYCEEVTIGRKYRIELYLNGWANLFIGAKEARDIADFKLSGKQKDENGQFEQVKTGGTMDPVEKQLALELASALRSHVREAVWKRNFDKRNIRCIIYTCGFG